MDSFRNFFKNSHFDIKKSVKIYLISRLGGTSCVIRVPKYLWVHGSFKGWGIIDPDPSA